MHQFLWRSEWEGRESDESDLFARNFRMPGEKAGATPCMQAGLFLTHGKNDLDYADVPDLTTAELRPG